MNLSEKLELVSRCMTLITERGREASKDSLYCDIEGLRIDANRYEDDLLNLNLTLRAAMGRPVFVIYFSPFIDIDQVDKGQWPDELAADALKKLRNLMLLDDLARV
jgi:hypothetical protein